MKGIKFFYTFILFLFIAFFLDRQEIFAAGPFLTDGYAQVAPSEFRAAISYDGTTETIIESTTFTYNPLLAWNFIWVIPVPEKPEAEIIFDDFFNKLDYLTKSNLNKKNIFDSILYFDIRQERNLPSQVYSRPVNIRSIEVLTPDKLQDFASMYGFVIPKEAMDSISEYGRKNWYFVDVEVDASHMGMAASDTLTTVGAHTLPVKIRFKTDKIIYPLKFASIRSDLDSEVVPLSYDYGISSEKVLGEKDEKVDELLSEKSKNKYPTLPLDFLNVKIELSIFAKDRSRVEGFSEEFANWVDRDTFEFKDSKGNIYFKLEGKRNFLTRIFSYKPVVQFEDLVIKKANDNLRVNPVISTKEKLIRTFLALMVILWAGRFVIRRTKSRIVPPHDAQVNRNNK